MKLYWDIQVVVQGGPLRGGVARHQTRRNSEPGATPKPGATPNRGNAEARSNSILELHQIQEQLRAGRGSRVRGNPRRGRLYRIRELYKAGSNNRGGYAESRIRSTNHKMVYPNPRTAGDIVLSGWTLSSDLPEYKQLHHRFQF